MKNSKYLQGSIVIVFLLFISTSTRAQSLHPKFKAIHQEFFGKFPKKITFSQKTTFYRADTIFRTQTWHEAGIFPNLFRIDIGDPKDGNGVIYRGDSTYNFRKFQKLKPSITPNILVYLLGGMYFETPDQVALKLKNEGFDLSKGYKSSWNGKDVEVFGSDDASDNSKSQLWFDAKDHYLVKMIQQKGNSRLECQFEKHQKIGKVWHENYVKVYSNNVLVQAEEYSNFKENNTLIEDFFNPDKLGSWHWMN